MLLQMGFGEMVERRRSKRYERLTDDDEKMPSPKRRWVKRMNGRLKGLRLSRSRKLNWKAFSVVILPKRIARIYADIVKRIMKMDAVCPGIIFSCQWGLPVLSHPTSSSLGDQPVSIMAWVGGKAG
ncbi:hypothetical protein RJ640_008752 [Escallonia rubra]|uniref:Uncharacterized protein n=1 Tax=Escallonia rubra TaxID=112253 RepID=A0AA88QKD0_9ASTE|nr:hypothetical protein RJ640_008752 [Escallonia rubra]